MKLGTDIMSLEASPISPFLFSLTFNNNIVPMRTPEVEATLALFNIKQYEIA
jgi:hypothetical protein